MKQSELGEFGFIEKIRQAVSEGQGVRLGIGDDCAVLEIPEGQQLLTSTDMLIEGIHFRRDWTDLEALGRKSVAVNVSDIAAMGGTPRHLYLSLGIPADMALEELDAFIEGFLQSARYYGATLVGGDTCRSPGPFLISVVAEGIAPAQEVVSRQGARPGDAVYVSGTLGDSALALQQLAKGQSLAPFLAQRHHDPVARTDLGRLLAKNRIPSAMIDLSDGLMADLGHILDASTVGAQLYLEAIPLSDHFQKALKKDSALWDLALAGGEDYELLFTVPPEKEQFLPDTLESACLSATRVGIITAHSGELIVKDSRGGHYTPCRKGYNHFKNGG